MYIVLLLFFYFPYHIQDVHVFKGSVRRQREEPGRLHAGQFHAPAVVEIDVIDLRCFFFYLTNLI